MYHNTSYPPSPPLPFAPPSNFLCHGNIAHKHPPTDVMLLFHASSVLASLLLLLHLSFFLLAKLFQFVHHHHTFQGDVDEHESETATDECYYEKEDLLADIIGGETLVFLRRGSALDDSLVLEQGEDSKEVVSLEGDDTFVYESEYNSPLEDLFHENTGIQNNDAINSPKTDVLTPLDSRGFAFEDKVFENTKERKEFSESTQPYGEKLRVGDQVRDNFGGSLTGESTSKSSVEWRSSTIFRDSETDYSSSRKSSSRWESYALFRKYDEEMLFFDRITASKLTETESLRSIKVNPRSISERIIHKLSTKPLNHSMGRRGPYQELESAYVAQICLTWEALNWNYANFRQKNSDCNNEGCGCPARIAQQFQQFLVLLQRFIENEPYEYGRRPEVYARRRISSPKLLQVPEFRDSEGDEGEEDTSSNISSDEFVVILEDAIRTFMNFLKADKEKCSDKVRAFMRRRTGSSDPVFHRFLIKANKKKKLRLKEIGKRCMRRRKLKWREEMEVVMGLIDLKVVSRVLRMADISNEQLHWCEEKMSKVRVWGAKMQRDSSPLFFPLH